MNGAQIVYDIFYLVIFNIVVAGMEFNFFLRFFLYLKFHLLFLKCGGFLVGLLFLLEP